LEREKKLLNENFKEAPDTVRYKLQQQMHKEKTLNGGIDAFKTAHAES
jgi:hypothetical protein